MPQGELVSDHNTALLSKNTICVVSQLIAFLLGRADHCYDLGRLYKYYIIISYIYYIIRQTIINFKQKKPQTHAANDTKLSRCDFTKVSIIKTVNSIFNPVITNVLKYLQVFKTPFKIYSMSYNSGRIRKIEI